MDTPAECQTCLGVARGGRIRVTKDSSQELLTLALDRRHELRELRRISINSGHRESTLVYEGQLRTITLSIEELRRTRQEMGWHSGQSERSDS